MSLLSVPLLSDRQSGLVMADNGNRREEMSGDISMVSSKTIISPRRGTFGEERGGAEDSEGEVEFDII